MWDYIILKRRYRGTIDGECECVSCYGMVSENLGRIEDCSLSIVLPVPPDKKEIPYSIVPVHVGLDVKDVVCGVCMNGLVTVTSYANSRGYRDAGSVYHDI